MNKYPDYQNGSNHLINHNRSQLEDLYDKCNEFLIKEPAKQEIQKQELRSILDNHRLEMHLQTADLLTDLEFADDANLKKLYNYNLATNRNNYESMLEVREEYLTQKNDP